VRDESDAEEDICDEAQQPGALDENIGDYEEQSRGEDGGCNQNDESVEEMRH